MAFQKKLHPLGWGDKELAYLVSTGMNMTNLYRAMGYKGRNVTDDFKERVRRLGYIEKHPDLLT